MKFMPGGGVIVREYMQPVGFFERYQNGMNLLLRSYQLFMDARRSAGTHARTQTRRHANLRVVIVVRDTRKTAFIEMRFHAARKQI